MKSETCLLQVFRRKEKGERMNVLFGTSDKCFRYFIVMMTCKDGQSTIPILLMNECKG